MSGGVPGRGDSVRLWREVEGGPSVSQPGFELVETDLVFVWQRRSCEHDEPFAAGEEGGQEFGLRCDEGLDVAHDPHVISDRLEGDLPGGVAEHDVGGPTAAQFRNRLQKLHCGEFEIVIEMNDGLPGGEEDELAVEVVTRDSFRGRFGESRQITLADHHPRLDLNCK